MTTTTMSHRRRRGSSSAASSRRDTRDGGCATTARRALVMCVASTAIVGARASSGMFSAVLRATGGGGTAEASGSDGGDASSTSSIEEFDANARESATAAAIRKGARVRLTSERARELTSAPMMAVYGGLGERGETVGALDVLAGSSSGDYLVWCHQSKESDVARETAALGSRSSKKDSDDDDDDDDDDTISAFTPLPLASVGTAVHAEDRQVLFHGGYKIWNGGSEFSDVSTTTAFDMDAGAFKCLTSSDDDGDAKASLGARKQTCPKLGGEHTGKRDEEVAVVTSKPIYLPDPEEARAEAALGAVPELGKHLSTPELPALDVDDDEESSKSKSTKDSRSTTKTKQHALIIFGGRDENDERLDSVYALGLADNKWRKIDYELPPARKDMVPQGPFEMPLIVKNEHAQGKPFPIGRSGASAVVTRDNKMVIYGGFVVEGKLGFNVGETLVLDLNTMKFTYPKVSGNVPVRRNKHTAVLDDANNMWVWGGSVWDHTGGSSTYASTGTYRADLGDTDNIVWHRMETKGKPPSQRRFHSAIIMDGGMYIIGGEDYSTRTYLSDVHRLDLETLTWTQPAVMGGINGGRIRAASFPWSPAKIDTDDKEKAAAAALGKSSKSHRKELDDEAAKSTPQTSASVIDASTCGTGTPARVRTGENQPQIETLISALVDGSSLGSKKSNKGETVATLAANLAASGWIPNTARGSSILSESSMIWKKSDTSSVGKSETLPGWITDKGHRDSSILTETLQADPEADSIEARLIQAVKASKKADDADSAHVGEREHAKDKDDDDDDEKKRHRPASSKDDDKEEEDSRDRRASSKDDSDEDSRRRRSHDEDDEDDDKKSSRSRHTDDDDRDDEDSRRRHASTTRHDEDEDEREPKRSSRQREREREEDREEEDKPKKLSAAARLIQQMSRGHEASLGKHGEPYDRDSADLGRVVSESRKANTDATQHSHAYLAVGVLAVLAAIAAGSQQFVSSKFDDESSAERIPLVVNSVASSEASPSGATWQKEAAKRRGVQFGFMSSDGEADELC